MTVTVPVQETVSLPEIPRLRPLPGVGTHLWGTPVDESLREVWTQEQ